MSLDSELLRALRTVHQPDAWVHLGTAGKDGWPHVTPVMMGTREDVLLFSITGKQKKRNIERDPRVCVELARPGDYAHVIVWGEMQLRNDDEAQTWWDDLMKAAFPYNRVAPRKLSDEGTSLGVLTPIRHRVFQLK